MSVTGQESKPKIKSYIITDYVDYKEQMKGAGELIYQPEILLEFYTKNSGFITCKKLIDNKICITKVVRSKKKSMWIEIPLKDIERKLITLTDSADSLSTRNFFIYVSMSHNMIIKIYISTEEEQNFEFINQMYQDEGYIKHITKEIIHYSDGKLNYGT